MKEFSGSLAELIQSPCRNRTLILTLTKSSFAESYRGSVLGNLWSLVLPFAMLLVYTFVFGVVLSARWGNESEGGIARFAVTLFSGLMLHAFFAECLTKATTQIRKHETYVKKILFPLEILAWVVVLPALLRLLVNLLVLFVALWYLDVPMDWLSLCLPVVITPLALIAMGASWFLLAIGVYFRDIEQLVQPFTVALLFLSGVFFPLSALPDSWLHFALFNPLAIVIDQVRALVFEARLPNWLALLELYLVSGFVLWIGFVFFQKTRRGFADVL